MCRRVEVRIDNAAGDEGSWTTQDGCLVMLHGRPTFTAVYWVNEEPERVADAVFDRAQYQV